MPDVIALTLVVAGCAFFFAGTVGVLRFPDVFTRLHALTKADGLGLGLVVTGLAVGDGTWPGILRLAATWALVLVASAASSSLIARAAVRRGSRPWVRPPDAGA